MRRRARRLRLRRGVIIAAMLAGACLLGGCSRQSILTTHSPQSHDITMLWWWMLAVAGVVFLGAVALLVLVALAAPRTEGCRSSASARTLNVRLVVMFGIAIPIVAARRRSSSSPTSYLLKARRAADAAQHAR